MPAFGFAFYSPKERFKEPELERSTIYLSCKPEPVYVLPVDDSSLFQNFPLKSYPRYTTTTSGDPIPCGSSPALMSCDFPESGMSGIICPPCGSSPALMSCDFHESGIICSNSSQIFDVKESALKSAVRGMGSEKRLVRSKEIAIGAGAKIDQDLHLDHYSLETWKETPDSVMTIYFVFQDKLEELIAGGMRDLKTTPEGLLEGLPVG